MKQLYRLARGQLTRARHALQNAALSRSAGLLISILSVVLVVPLPVAPARADAAEPIDGPGALCEAWALIAASEHGVPSRLMRAIALVETGREINGTPTPWPWSINDNGQSIWAGSRTEARALAEQRRAAGADSLDLGCFQLNTRWHGRAFSSFDDMLDPAQNARYAARYLAALHTELGDWTAAAAAYHSRTPAHGRTYLAKLQVEIARFGPEPEDPSAQSTGLARPAALIPGARRSMGSLVPTGGGRAPLASGAASLFAPRRPGG
ncbi:MAG: transglycosylase SLT domain-containing protein [Pseudomonadota bacterium]